MTIKLDEDYLSLFLQWLEALNSILIGLEEDGETLRKKPVSSIELLYLPRNEQCNRTLNLKLYKNNTWITLKNDTPTYEILARYDQYNKNPYADWEWLEIPESNRYIYIKELILPPIDFLLSFSRRIKTNKTDSPFIFDMITSALGKAFTNIDEAPIHLQGFKLNFVFETKAGIIEKLTSHYTHSIISTVLKVIGSINIIGNPLGLYNYIRAGFIELIERPKAGLVHGPLEAGLGALIGAGCLLKQTFAGTFNSIHHISGSIATGLTILSFDDSFIEKRRKFKLKKPKNIIEGVDQGLRSIYSGIEEGVTGLVIKPYIGGKKEGIGGAVKGAVTGFSGLLLKPITGLCEATSKTAEGLKNTAVHFDDKANEERVRNPRVFYELEGYIKKYDEIDADARSLLQEVKKGIYRENTFVESFLINRKKDWCFLIVTVQDIMCWSQRRRKFHWRVGVNEILRVEKKRDEKNIEIIKVEIWLKRERLKDKVYIYIGRE